jgi:peroxiredoxin Q/BCP
MMEQVTRIRACTVLRFAIQARAGLSLIVLLACIQVGCTSARRAAEMESAAAARSTLTGEPAIDFTLPNQDGQEVNLADYRGKWVVLYFYPADGTPGCTCQAREFTEHQAGFQRLTAVVFGISPDSVASHHQVTQKFGLKVPLLSDADHKVMEAYGAWVWTPFGSRAIRSTVLIDPGGRIAYHWPEVIPEGHAERVRAKLAEIKAGAVTP